MRFDDAELMKVQQSLQSGLDELNKKRSAKRDHVHEMDAVSGSLSPEAQAEYEKKVIMESVARAKARCGLEKERQSEALSSIPPKYCIDKCADGVDEGDFVILPFPVLQEHIGIAEKIIFLYLYSIAKNGKALATLRQITEGTYIGKTCACQALSSLRDAGWLNWETVRIGSTRLNSYSILKWRCSVSFDNGSYHRRSSESEQCSQNGQCSENGHSSEFEQSSESGQCSHSEQKAKSLAITGFVAHSSQNEQCSESEQCSQNGQCSDYEYRRKIVDTTEFRQDLVRILREVKIRDLKDLKDLKILKDLKDNKNKISDFVDNLCITFVDKSLVPEYLMTMFRIAFPDQSAEKLQVVRKLTERLQKGFAWYVVLLFLIKSSPYLMGKDKDSEGWKCTLTWALAADNYPKIMDLTYVKYGLRWTPHNFIEFLCRSLERGEY